MTVRPGFLALDRIVHRAALIGRVLDGLGRTPLEGAEVTLVSGPAAWTARLDALRAGQPRRRPERLVTDASGFFKYLDLPPGTYALRAALPGTRYAAATGTATVATSGAAAIDLALAPTALAGIVKTGATGGPLAMARVRVVDSGETAYTGADGGYTLSPLEPGTDRKIEISAQRHATQTLAVTLAAGQTTTAVPITLTNT